MNSLWAYVGAGILGVFTFSFLFIYVSLGRFLKETADVDVF